MKYYQVRYPFGEGETVAHEHETEKGAKADAKTLSKALGTAMLGEIEVKEDGSHVVLRTWEYNGGKAEKPVARNTPASEVKVVKTVDETKLPEPEIKEKAKTTMTPLEKQKAKLEAEAAKLKAMEDGTYVLPGRKPRDPNAPPKEKAAKADDVESYVAKNNVTADEAKFMIPLHFSFKDDRAKIVLSLFRAPQQIMSTPELLEVLNATENETGSPRDSKYVVRQINHIGYLMFKKQTGYTITSIGEGAEKSYKLNTGAKLTPIEPTEETESGAEEAA